MGLGSEAEVLKQCFSDAYSIFSNTHPPWRYRASAMAWGSMQSMKAGAGYEGKGIDDWWGCEGWAGPALKEPLPLELGLGPGFGLGLLTLPASEALGSTPRSIHDQCDVLEALPR